MANGFGPAEGARAEGGDREEEETAAQRAKENRIISRKEAAMRVLKRQSRLGFSIATR